MIMFPKPKRMGRWIAIAVAIGLFCSAEAQAKKPPNPGGGGADYNLVVLAPSGQATSSFASDLDDLGNVVGNYSDSVNNRIGFYYDRAEDSYRLFGPGVEVFGLNNLGEMVGADDNTGEGLYWISAADENPVTLSPLAGHQTSEARRVNDAGIIVGNSQGVAVAWKVNENGVVSAPIELPFLQGDAEGLARGVSERNVDGVSRIVGSSGVGLQERAVMWEVAVDADGAPFLHSGPTDLGSLEGGFSVASGVNLDGDIVGRSARESGYWPFVKPAGQPMQPLPLTRKATHGVAVGINDLGQMVGRQLYTPPQDLPVFKPVLWPDAGSMIDLSKKVALGRDEELEGAYAINNAGDILAYGYFPNLTSRDTGCLLIRK